MSLTDEQIKQAIARAWCHPKNEHKEMDVHLALAAAEEVSEALRLAGQHLEHAGWQYRDIDPVYGPSKWFVCSAIDAEVLKKREWYEVREVFAVKNAAGQAPCYSEVQPESQVQQTGGLNSLVTTPAGTSAAGEEVRKDEHRVPAKPAPAAPDAAKSERACTCHPDDNPPQPCQKKYALAECRGASAAEAAPSALSLIMNYPGIREYIGSQLAELADKELLAKGGDAIDTDRTDRHSGEPTRPDAVTGGAHPSNAPDTEQ